jgi:hypothetical protein
VLNFKILGKASGCIQALAGSIISKSAVFQESKYFFKKSSTFAFSNSIFSKLLSFALVFQSSELDLTISTEITFLASAFAKIIQIVPVQPYKSKTVKSFNLSFLAKSKTNS